MGRKTKQDQPLAPLRVRVHPRIIRRYHAVATATGVAVADLQRAALERAAAPSTLESLAEELKQ